ncbi:MAG: hypothetical protein ACJA13_001062 [Paraglaciecola sp.]|jgi:hypothetical protein
MPHCDLSAMRFVAWRSRHVLPNTALIAPKSDFFKANAACVDFTFTVLTCLFSPPAIGFTHGVFITVAYIYQIALTVKAHQRAPKFTVK